MILTKHQGGDVERWAMDGAFLAPEFNFKRFCGICIQREIGPHLEFPENQ